VDYLTGARAVRTRGLYELNLEELSGSEIDQDDLNRVILRLLNQRPPVGTRHVYKAVNSVMISLDPCFKRRVT
jgi:hypothetical protein